MQPAQLSLIPEQLPAPPEALIDHLPRPGVEAAMTLLAHLIAKTVATRTTAAGSEAGDE